jgi:hypothetical protein
VEELKALRRGWSLGGRDFRQRVLAMMDGLEDRLGKNQPMDGGPRREHTEGEAERLVGRALQTLGVKDEDLPGMRKSNPRKIMIGTLVRKRTMAGNAWIAKRLTMGDPSRVSRYCADAARNGERAFHRRLNRLEKMANNKG